jgi:hypothetical protein
MEERIVDGFVFGKRSLSTRRTQETGQVQLDSNVSCYELLITPCQTHSLTQIVGVGGRDILN